jgi:hypothetical protein
VVVFFDYDVDRVSRIIEDNFAVDEINSSNRDELLSVNEVGYRSVHYVCDLGRDRVRLKENRSLNGMKFEIQVRTVLQHAWAELAHDRNYKFSGQLPKQIERKLFLLAGLMETADNGFSDLSREIDSYLEKVSASTAAGNLDIELNSLSLDEFVRKWANDVGFPLEEGHNRDAYDDLFRELKQFGVTTLKGLREMIPDRFVERYGGRTSTVFGVVRDWMIISDPQRFIRDVEHSWNVSHADLATYYRFLEREDYDAIERAFSGGYNDTEVWSDDEE